MALLGSAYVYLLEAARTAEMAMTRRPKKNRARTCAPESGELPFPCGWGGWRPGSGRKCDPRSGVRHGARPKLSRHTPLHLTWRFSEDLPNLRRPELVAALRAAFDAGKQRFGFRLVQFSVQANHLHLIAEADDEQALSRGMRALGVRIARGVNRVLGRSGQVFADRYHALHLTTPSQVRNALRYVLNNALHHGLSGALPDPCSSGPAFDGWRDRFVHELPWAPVCAARCWLLRVGWLQWGRIGLREVPSGVD